MLSPSTLNTQRLRLADMLYRAKYSVAALFVSLCLVFLLFFGSEITYENLRLLLRNLDAGYNASPIGVQYKTEEGASAELYRGNLAVADCSYLSLYTLSGRLVYSYPLSYQQPMLVASEEYLLVYDFGGTSYMVLNVAGRVFEEKNAAYPILGVALADNGAYALLTKTREYRSAITVYSSSFLPIWQYETEQYIVGAAFAPSGDSLAVSSLSSSNGIYTTHVSLYNFSGKEAVYHRSAADLMPLRIFTLGNDKVVVVCDTALLVCLPNGTLETISYGYRTPSLVAAGKSEITVAFTYAPSANHTELLTVSAARPLSPTFSVTEGRIHRLTYAKDDLFLLKTDCVLKRRGDEWLSADLKNGDAAFFFTAIDAQHTVVSFAEESIIVAFP